MDLIQDTRAKATRALAVDGGRLYGAWGLAWLLGFGAIWLSVRADPTYRTPPAWAFVVLGVCLAAALAISVLTMDRARHGVTGPSSTWRKWYGWAWVVSFTCVFLLTAGVAHAGASAAVIGLVASAGPVLVVSVMYLVGGSLWHDGTMFIIGAWLALTIGVAVLFGTVTFDLILAIAGGGGFVMAALYDRHVSP